MASTRLPSMKEEIPYVGSELDIFADAVRWKSHFCRQLRPFIRGNVLEVGAGIGGTTRVLRAGTEASWTCLEPDRGMAARLADAIRGGNDHPGSPMQVVAGSVQELSPEAKFDTILYIDVLEHIRDDHQELKDASARLADEGHIIVLAPAHQWLYSPFDKAIGHYRRYSRRTLRDAAPPELRVVRLRYLDSVGLLASLANRLLLRSSMPTRRQIAVWDGMMIPVSRVMDPAVGYGLGKSVLAIWRRDLSRRS